MRASADMLPIHSVNPGTQQEAGDEKILASSRCDELAASTLLGTAAAYKSSPPISERQNLSL